jgi:epoxyqueuosine reductase
MGMTVTIPFTEIKKLCAAEGLTAAGVLSPVPERLDATWLERMEADGVGDMDWIQRTRTQRLHPTHMMPEAKALLAVAMAYQPIANCGELQRARYTAGKDYHDVLRKKLGRIGVILGQRCGSPSKGRAAVDSAPLNERTLAAMAGLGWIGRNALLISPDAGTYRLLGFLLTDAALEPHHAGHGSDRCGRCTACEQRCPTAALVDRRVLSTRCISYLTIEHLGIIPKALAERFEGWWFGCDLCQSVCPWNRFAGEADDPRLLGREIDAEVLAVTAETFDLHFAGRAIRRIGYERFRRNLLVALFSLGKIDACHTIIAEGLPLVGAQAQELGLKPVAET